MIHLDISSGRTPVGLVALLGLLVLTLLVARWRAARAGDPARSDRWITALAVAMTLVVLAGVSLVKAPPLLELQMLPDGAEYAEGAWNVARGHGYLTTYETLSPVPGPVIPRYPPGFSLALVPFAALSPAFPANIFWGAKVYALLYVLAPVSLAWRLGGPVAGAAVAAMLGVSPFTYTAAGLVMSDPLAAALTVLLVGLLHRPTRATLAAAGLVTGALVWIKLSSAWQLGAVLLAAPARWRARALVAALPLLLGLGAYQWLLFGSPLITDYDQYIPRQGLFSPLYAVSHVVRPDSPVVSGDNFSGYVEYLVCGCRNYHPNAILVNLAYYPALLLGVIWTFAPPFATAPGLLYMLRQRRRPEVLLGLLLVIGGVLPFVFYLFQARRFIAGPALILIVYSGVALAEVLDRWLRQRAASPVAVSAPVAAYSQSRLILRRPGLGVRSL